MYNIPHQLQVAADFGPAELLSVQTPESIPDKVTHTVCQLITIIIAV